MLYIVATPIGNLKDITLRAIETLKACDFIIAENPRHSLNLLKHYEVPSKKIIQFADHNEQRVLSSIIHQLSTQNAALITDAGTPGISDPGFRLVRECVKENIQVVPIPGPSAAVAALSASGLPTDRFLFLGFLQRTENKVVKALTQAKEVEATAVFYESPFRIQKTLQFIASNFPEARVIVARELTKLYEEFLRGAPSEALRQVTKDKLRGEFTVLVSFKEPKVR